MASIVKHTAKGLILSHYLKSRKKLMETKGLLLSQEFVLAAGTIMFNQKLNKICLIRNKKRELFLPKGRKNVGESLEQAALRETYEETGFRCKLLPANIHSRAVPISTSKKHIPDVIRICKGVTEPVAISMRPGPDNNQKIIFWFIAVADNLYNQSTHMENESFQVHFYTFGEALQQLTFENDIKLLKSVIQVVQTKNNRSIAKR